MMHYNAYVRVNVSRSSHPVGKVSKLYKFLFLKGSWRLNLEKIIFNALILLKYVLKNRVQSVNTFEHFLKHFLPFINYINFICNIQNYD